MIQRDGHDEVVAEEGGAGGVGEGGGEVRGEGVGGAVELEADEDVEGEALAVRREEEVVGLGLGLGPGEEVEEGALVGLGIEENVRSCLGSEVRRERCESLRVAF